MMSPEIDVQIIENKLLNPLTEKNRQLERLSSNQKHIWPSLTKVIKSFTESFIRMDQASEPLEKEENEKLLKCITICGEEEIPIPKLQMAVMEIGALAPDEHVPSLEVFNNLLYHPDFRIRINICQALGKIGGERAEEMLYGLLNDKMLEVRQAAQEALGVRVSEKIARNLYSYWGRGSTMATNAIVDEFDENEKRNVEVFKGSAEKLMADYPNEYLAFCNGRFVGHNKDLERLKIDLSSCITDENVLVIEPVRNNEPNE